MLMIAKEEGGRDKLGVWDSHIHTAIYKNKITYIYIYIYVFLSQILFPYSERESHSVVSDSL